MGVTMSAEADLQERQIRAARNQSFFRELNEKIRDESERFRGADEPSDEVRVTFVCECADMTCAEQMELTLQRYVDVRENPTRFPVKRGHIYPDVERVVADEDGYMVVEKFATAGYVAAVLGAGEDEERSAIEPGGYDRSVDQARRRWLEKLVGICDQALRELPDRDPPPLEMIGDFREFRSRLAAELRDDSRTAGARQA